MSLVGGVLPRRGFPLFRWSTRTPRVILRHWKSQQVAVQLGFLPRGGAAGYENEPKTEHLAFACKEHYLRNSDGDTVHRAKPVEFALSRLAGSQHTSIRLLK